MNIKSFIQIIRRHWWLILAGAFLCGGAAWYVLSGNKQEFSAQALMSTNIISAATIENTGESKSTDRDYAQNELENLVSLATSQRTFTQLATRMLASYLCRSNESVEGWGSAEELAFMQTELFTDKLRAYCDTSYEATLKALQNALKQSGSNPVRALIYSDEPYFGIEYLRENAKVTRRGSSDLLHFSYTCNDPDVAQRTLEVYLDFFEEEHTRLKRSQSSEVADYFQSATLDAKARLDAAEAAMLSFRVQNNIINYDEQTRTIAIRKEDLDELKFKENMNMQGQQAARQRVEGELGNRNMLADINDGMINLREELGRVESQIAKLEISPDPANDRSRLDQLKDRKAELQRQMTDFVKQSYNFQRSPNGLQTQQLLDEWLNTIVAEEGSTARLNVIGQRQQEFADIYGQYAPWGSQIKELQREIDLAESEYLENLHSLNQAMLHRQHTQAATLEMVDEPYLPVQDPDYKRYLLAIMAFMGGGTMVLAALIVLAFLDESLKKPEVVQRKTGLQVATVLPNLRKGKSYKDPARRQAAMQQALALLVQQIKVETLQNDTPPRIIMVASTRPGEGKTALAAHIANTLRAEDNRVLCLEPVEAGVLPNTNFHEDDRYYELSSRMLDAERLDDLEIFGHFNRVFEAFHYVILEVPALLSGKYPLALLRNLDLVLLACRANRTWDAADAQALLTLQRAGRAPVRVVLNGVDTDTLEEFMGVIPTNNAFPEIHRNKASSHKHTASTTTPH